MTIFKGKWCPNFADLGIDGSVVDDFCAIFSCAHLSTFLAEITATMLFDSLFFFMPLEGPIKHSPSYVG